MTKKIQGLRFGTLDRCAHICVDMQRMFAEETPWMTPWMNKVLPHVADIAGAHPESTIFTRFIPPVTSEYVIGSWRRYYERWASMTLDQLGANMIDLVPELALLVPPARLVDKAVYSPWITKDLSNALREWRAKAVIVSGGETDVCVLATVMGAIDRGYRVVIASDALCSSSDDTHDALMKLYEDRFSEQIEVATSEAILSNWCAPQSAENVKHDTF